MKVSVTNIEYDTDGENIEGIELPNDMTIEVEDNLEASDIHYQVSEAIAGEVGFCAYCFAMDIPKMTSEEYIADGGNKCPHCRSTNISGERVETDDYSAWRVIECEDCDKSWTEIFKMTSMEMDDE